MKSSFTLLCITDNIGGKIECIKFEIKIWDLLDIEQSLSFLVMGIRMMDIDLMSGIFWGMVMME